MNFLTKVSNRIGYLMPSSPAQIALEAVSAVHQLTSAFHTLSLCVRPLITAGFPLAAAGVDGMAIEAGSVSSSDQLTPEQVCSPILSALGLGSMIFTPHSMFCLLCVKAAT